MNLSKFEKDLVKDQAIVILWDSRWTIDRIAAATDKSRNHVKQITAGYDRISKRHAREKETTEEQKR